MGFLSAIGERMFASVIEQKVSERLSAASASPADDMQWRRLTGNSDRELPIATWQRQVEICYWLWKTNPMANWIIESMGSFVAGKGFSYTCKNDDVRQILDEFWNDPVNRMDLKFGKKARELGIFGLQCWQAFVSPQTGRVRLGVIDPAQVAEVYTDPDNVEMRIGVKVYNHDSGETRYLKTILPREADDMLSPYANQMRDGYADGECFLYAVNQVSNDPYGTSDLFVIADWLEEYEDFVFDYSQKAKKQNAYIWDVTMNGSNDTECQDFADQFATQEDGAIRVHNEKVTWQAVAPKLQALEVKESADVFRNHILGCKSIPAHWYGGLADANRASAAESNDPIKAFIDDRQMLLKFVLEDILTYVIEKALDARYLTVPRDVDPYEFSVQTPEAMERDVTKTSSAVTQLATTIAVAQANNWVDQDTAMKMFAFIIAMVGYDFDPEQMEPTKGPTDDYQGVKQPDTAPPASEEE
ncbi:hypothetical protein HTZ97_16325 [Desulfuromonas acetoxidans]|uniref:Portal protein n=1 Tax=Desulfuromonas acetoxidans (strain DSM 684 / 11070) TaxID=281689 RepID=Q1K068_DESA6|nr:hypothetical protein [Desulfuromonas acetoxidans]EAT16073.1 hypothetical protein Dace_2374 [Desulfuromonas acetoxidans DSM 684]MBF0646888.1 hypothetical protein [Desulfuromonas acetoxidans]NVD26165.1 hypothetical protein [Desulfuromonas acetoxidans]NVE18023.1 hypothetical protein [Desulfuromonas acetoxidans]